MKHENYNTLYILQYLNLGATNREIHCLIIFRMYKFGRAILDPGANREGNTGNCKSD